MKPEKTRAIIKRKIKEIAGLSEKVGKDFDKDIIHEFRVAVKVLRAFLRLLRTHHSEPGLKMPKKFKRLYQTAGAIRDAQLELKKLSGVEPPILSYFQMLEQTLERQKKEWEIIYSKDILKKMETRLLSYKYEPVPPEVLASFFDDQMTSINNLSKHKFPSDNQVHSIRKVAKDIMYNSIIAQKKWKAAYEQAEKMPEQKLNNITQVIGDFNDDRNALAHLSSFSSKKTGKDEEGAIRELCEEEAALLVKQKKEIMDMVKKLVEGK